MYWLIQENSVEFLVQIGLLYISKVYSLYILYICYNQSLMFTMWLHHKLYILELFLYDVIIGYTVAILVSISCSRCCFLHVLFIFYDSFTSYIIDVFLMVIRYIAIDTILYSYILPIDSILYSYLSLCLKLQPELSLRS